MLLLPKYIAGWSGWAVDSFGYVSFFAGTAALGLPVLLLVWLAARAQRATPAAPGSAGQRYGSPSQ
jgi:PAT family beta-lactamase induction signal transducer AmpG